MSFYERVFNPQQIETWITGAYFNAHTDTHRPQQLGPDSTRATLELAQHLNGYILFEDSDLLILNKPAGVVSHEGDRNPVGVEEICRFVRANSQICLVHRLDKDTSGAIILTKTPTAYEQVAEQFADKDKHHLYKRYLAILDGHFPCAQTVQAGIENPPALKKVKVHSQPYPHEQVKDSITIITPASVFYRGLVPHTLASVQIITGRKHQIRAITSHLGFPVTGDRIYNPHPYQATRQLLHAYQISFSHPTTKETMCIEAPIPDDLVSFYQTGSGQMIIDAIADSQ